MRENMGLYRGKRKDGKGWVEGYYYSRTAGAWNVPAQNAHFIMERRELNGGEIISIGDHDVDLATVGQFTGLLDKNGVKVFEGDVVRIRQNELCNITVQATVEYGIPKCGFCLHTELDEWFQMDEFGSDVEIIGNIHDNPAHLEATS